MNNKYIYIGAIVSLVIIIVIIVIIFSKQSSSSVDCSKIDGKWTEWGTCDTDLGKQRKNYITANPDCNKTQLQGCDVDCVANYSDWTSCNSITGKQKKVLNISVTPKENGKTCESKYGPLEMVKDCPLQCTGSWSDWSKCDTNTNQQIRYFLPQIVSSDCPSPEIRSCN
jgi:hypothetical protein